MLIEMITALFLAIFTLIILLGSALGSSRLVRRIVGNLISNAVKFSPPDAEVSVTDLGTGKGPASGASLISLSSRIIAARDGRIAWMGQDADAPDCAETVDCDAVGAVSKYSK